MPPLNDTSNDEDLSSINEKEDIEEYNSDTIVAEAITISHHTYGCCLENNYQARPHYGSMGLNRNATMGLTCQPIKIQDLFNLNHSLLCSFSNVEHINHEHNHNMGGAVPVVSGTVIFYWNFEDSESNM